VLHRPELPGMNTASPDASETRQDKMDNLALASGSPCSQAEILSGSTGSTEEEPITVMPTEIGLGGKNYRVEVGRRGLHYDGQYEVISGTLSRYRTRLPPPDRRRTPGEVFSTMGGWQYVRGAAAVKPGVYYLVLLLLFLISPGARSVSLDTRRSISSVQDDYVALAPACSQDRA
jgi:hypothetical protein